MLHIGKRIQEVVKERGMTVVDFAHAIPCSRVHAYKIIQKATIDTGLLQRIGVVLCYDFFKDYSECRQKDDM